MTSFKTRKSDGQVFPTNRKSPRDSGSPQFVGVDKSQIDYKPKSAHDYMKSNPKKDSEKKTKVTSFSFKGNEAYLTDKELVKFAKSQLAINKQQGLDKNIPSSLLNKPEQAKKFLKNIGLIRSNKGTKLKKDSYKINWKEERHKELKDEINFWRNKNNNGFISINKIRKWSPIYIENPRLKYMVQINTPTKLHTANLGTLSNAKLYARKYMQ